MTAAVVRAIDQDAAHAHLAHLAEGDLLRPHAAIKTAAGQAGKLSIPWASERRTRTAHRESRLDPRARGGETEHRRLGISEGDSLRV